MSPRLEVSRRFGSTGVSVPLIGYGTAPLGKDHISREHAVRCLNHAIDRGITYLDTSPGYGSEPHIGQVMRSRRKEVFLATKVDQRRQQSVLEEIQKSLEKLQTDYVDLIQIHAVSAYADLEQALAEDGAIAALEEARSQGLMRHIGITGHARPDLLAQALRRYPFGAVLAALGMVDHLVTAPDVTLLPVAQEKGAAVIAMKVLGHGNNPNIERSVRYSLGLPGVSIAIIGMDSTEQIDEIVEIAARFEPLSKEEEQQLVDDVRPLIEKEADEFQEGKGSLFWLHDTKVMGWQKADEPMMVQY
jgi:uncharacterized protein